MNTQYFKTYSNDFKVMLVAVIYYVSAVFGHSLAFDSTVELPVWPPSGIAFALILLLGRKSWPGITIGALLANLMAYWNFPELPARTLIAISATVAVGFTIEAVLGNFLVRAWIGKKYPFDKTKFAFRFLFISVLMAFVGSGLGASSLFFNGVISSLAFIQTFISLWVSSIVGILLFTPFILAILTRILSRFLERS